MNKNVFSILHISDLHKDENCNYNQLLDSLKTDKERYQSLGIAPVKYIVVSGDLVHGSNKDDAKEACEDISQQYGEVSVFLQDLVNAFGDGDINRLIIVPGNHDMNRAVSKCSMKPIDATQVEKVKRSYWETMGGKQIYRFPVGLYGHQHKSEVVEALSDLSDDMDLDKVMLISSGTLITNRYKYS